MFIEKEVDGTSTQSNKNAGTSKNDQYLKWDATSGRLFMVRNGSETYVKAHPCFPWRDSFQHLSLRDAENNELAYVENPEDLTERCQKALLESLKESSFYFQVIRIESIEEEFELRIWNVVTQQGRRKFQTKLTDWPRILGQRFYVIQDVQKDLFVIEDVEKLDSKSQKLFWPFTD